MEPVLAIFGPTAVGKTAVALAVAERLRAAGADPVAIGADALQVYRGMSLLTAQPSAAERRALEHRLVGFLDPAIEWSVAEHSALAHAEIDAALAAGRTPIVVGGTGLYLRGAIAELSLAPPPPPGVREALLARAAEPGGTAALHAALAHADPASAAMIVESDTTRVVRAHELLATGRSFAAHAGADQLWTAETRHPTVLVGLTMERAALRERASERMHAMVGAGVLQEVAGLRTRQLGKTAAAAVGLHELAAGDIDKAIVRTRQLAKRQQTWMRRLPVDLLIDVTGRAAADVAAEITQRWQRARA